MEGLGFRQAKSGSTSGSSGSDTELLQERPHIEVMAHRFRLAGRDLDHLASPDLNLVAGGGDCTTRRPQRTRVSTAPRDFENDGVTADKCVVECGFRVGEGRSPSPPRRKKIVDSSNLPLGSDLIVDESWHHGSFYRIPILLVVGDDGRLCRTDE